MKEIHQQIEFNATPHQVYELLANETLHSKFTSTTCNISAKVGESFTCYDGYLEGKNLTLIPDKKIVQSWRTKGFPAGHFSTVTFEFEEKNGKTLLTFSQTDVPKTEYEHLSKGWKKQYWDKMKKYLARNT